MDEQAVLLRGGLVIYCCYELVEAASVSALNLGFYFLLEKELVAVVFSNFGRRLEIVSGEKRIGIKNGGYPSLFRSPKPLGKGNFIVWHT